MKKSVAILLVILMVSSTILGACASLTSEQSSNNTELTDDTVVATVNGEEVYYKEYVELWQMLSRQLGLNEEFLTDPENQEVATELRERILKTLVAEKVVKKELEENGFYDFTEEEKVAIDAKRDSDLEAYFKANFEAEMLEGLGEEYTDEQFAEAKATAEAKMYESINMTAEEVAQRYYDEEALRKGRAHYITPENMIPSDEQIQEKYDQYLEADIAAIGEDPIKYMEKKLRSTSEVYYVPEGVRNIKQILIGFTDEQQLAINEARQSGDEEAVKAVVDQAKAEIMPQAIEVLAELQSGEISFDEGIELYNSDPGMARFVDGYPVAAGNEVFVPSFTEGAMALENIGDMSGLVESDFGFHILEYSSDMTPGPIPFDSVKDAIASEMLPYMTDIAWESIVDGWFEDNNVVLYTDILN